MWIAYSHFQEMFLEAQGSSSAQGQAFKKGQLGTLAQLSLIVKALSSHLTTNLCRQGHLQVHPYLKLQNQFFSC